MRHLLSLLLLTTWCASSQPLLPRDAKGLVVYQGHVELPGLTQAQVLRRATEYAHYNFIPRDVRSPVWRVDSLAHTVSGLARYEATGRSFPSNLPLRFELVVRAQAGGYSYDIRHIEYGTAQQYIGPPPSMQLHFTLHYNPIEKPMDALAATPDSAHQQGLRKYHEAMASEMEAALAHLQAAMTKP